MLELKPPKAKVTMEMLTESMHGNICELSFIKTINNFCSSASGCQANRKRFFPACILVCFLSVISVIFLSSRAYCVSQAVIGLK